MRSLTRNYDHLTNCPAYWSLDMNACECWQKDTVKIETQNQIARELLAACLGIKEHTPQDLVVLAGAAMGTIGALKQLMESNSESLINFLEQIKAKEEAISAIPDNDIDDGMVYERQKQYAKLIAVLPEIIKALK